MKILVTGINGTVGGNIFRQLLLAEGYDVWGVSKKPYEFSDVLPEKNRNQVLSIDLKKDNLEDLASREFDVVVHAAAITPKAINAGVYFTDNREIADNICTYFKNKNGKFFFLSTGSVYANTNKISSEDSTLTSTDVYGLSMIDAENSMLKQLKNITILRLFYPYSFDKYTTENNLISKMSERIKKNEEITVSKTWDTAIINPVFFKDILPVINALIFSNRNPGIVNVASKPVFTFRKVLEYIAANENKKMPQIQLKETIGNPACADIKKLEEYFDINKLTGFDSGIKFISKNKSVIHE